MLSLRGLFLNKTPVRDLSPLVKLPNLETLTLKGTEFSDEQMRQHEEEGWMSPNRLERDVEGLVICWTSRAYVVRQHGIHAESPPNRRMTTTNPTTPKRWRPKFSVRTLVVLVTLVCCYAACWGPTKTRGVEDVRQRAFLRAANVTPVAPLVLRTKATYPGTGTLTRYYFWFFGYVAKLQYERDVAPWYLPDDVQYFERT